MGPPPGRLHCNSPIPPSSTKRSRLSQSCRALATLVPSGRARRSAGCSGYRAPNEHVRRSAQQTAHRIAAAPMQANGSKSSRRTSRVNMRWWGVATRSGRQPAHSSPLVSRCGHFSRPGASRTGAGGCDAYGSCGFGTRLGSSEAHASGAADDLLSKPGGTELARRGAQPSQGRITVREQRVAVGTRGIECSDAR